MSKKRNNLCCDYPSTCSLCDCVRKFVSDLLARNVTELHVLEILYVVFDVIFQINKHVLLLYEYENC